MRGEKTRKGGEIIEETIFPNLDQILEEKRISKRELCVELGITEKTFWNKQRGRTEFTLEEVEKICKKFSEYRFEYIFKREAFQ